MPDSVPTSKGSEASPAAEARGVERSGDGAALWGGSSPATWLIAVFLGVIATCLLLQSGGSLIEQAVGQPVRQAGARGVFAFTGQLDKNSYGVFMVDVDAGTIWCYEWNEGRDCLRLIAARTWRYDRYLEDFNSCNPSPREVERLVEIARARRLQEAGGSGD